MATANRVYDDIEPVSTWKSEQGFETLTVYLPGFKKDQIKVQVTTTRKLRVLGERPAGANKWIRFRKEFPIPPNADIDSISAKFEGANLVLKLPRPEPMPKQSLPSEPALVPKEKLTLPNPAARETEKAKQAEREAEERKQLEKALLEKLAREEEEVERAKEEVERAKKEETLKDAEKAKHCEGILTQDYRNKLNAYKQNLGGYMELMKNNNTAMNAGMVAPAAVVLLLSLGFCYAGGLFTCAD